MKSAKELEELFGVTNEQIEQWEEEASRGILPGEPSGPVVTGPGRPMKFGEEMRQVGFKEPLSRAALIDSRAAQLGLKRSDYLRELVDKDLAAAGLV